MTRARGVNNLFSSSNNARTNGTVKRVIGETLQATKATARASQATEQIYCWGYRGQEDPVHSLTKEIENDRGTGNDGPQTTGDVSGCGRGQ